MMKLTSKLLITVAAAFMASGAIAADSYIYWMASENMTDLMSGGTVDWSYAKVKAGESYLNIYADGVSIGLDSIDREDAIAGASWWGKFDSSLFAGGTTGSSILFELYNSSDDVVGYSSYYTWIPSSAISNGGDMSGATPYTLTGVVPEPTSGLLSLFGLAALALRRRRRA